MEASMAKYRLETLPEITDAQMAGLKALAARPAIAKSTTVTSLMTEEKWKNAVKYRAHFYRPVKQQITARVDADVLAWLKSQGRGYQSRIDAILRREMLQAAVAEGSSKAL